jgi:hypothetical protein
MVPIGRARQTEVKTPVISVPEVESRTFAKPRILSPAFALRAKMPVYLTTTIMVVFQETCPFNDPVESND